MREQNPSYPPVDPAPYRPSGEQLPLGSFPSAWEVENPQQPASSNQAERSEEAPPPSRHTSRSSDRDDHHQPAGFWRRAAALIADLLLVQFMAAILGSMSTMGVQRSTAGAPLDPQTAQEMAVMFAAQSLPLLLIGYFLFFTAYGGRTPGKMLMSLRVHTATGHPLTWTRTMGRTLCYLASVLTWGIGFLVAAGPDTVSLHI